MKGKNGKGMEKSAKAVHLNKFWTRRGKLKFTVQCSGMNMHIVMIVVVAKSVLESPTVFHPFSS